jgi:hypothetical protein
MLDSGGGASPSARPRLEQLLLRGPSSAGRPLAAECADHRSPRARAPDGRPFLRWSASPRRYPWLRSRPWSLLLAASTPGGFMVVAVDIDASTRNSNRRSRRARPPCQESTWRASSMHRRGRRVVVLAGAYYPEPRPPCVLKTTGPSCDAAVICSATVKNVFCPLSSAVVAQRWAVSRCEIDATPFWSWSVAA